MITEMSVYEEKDLRLVKVIAGKKDMDEEVKGEGLDGLGTLASGKLSRDGDKRKDQVNHLST